MIVPVLKKTIKGTFCGCHGKNGSRKAVGKGETHVHLKEESRGHLCMCLRLSLIKSFMLGLHLAEKFKM